MKTVKIIFFGTLLLIIIGLVLIQLWSEVVGLNLKLTGLIYWVFLLGWVGLVYNFKIKSFTSFGLGFGLFVMSAFLVIFNQFAVGEIVMRISLIFWLVGIAQALFEYRHNEKLK